jgi:hypothetical protein
MCMLGSSSTPDSSRHPRTDNMGNRVSAPQKEDHCNPFYKKAEDGYDEEYGCIVPDDDVITELEPIDRVVHVERDTVRTSYEDPAVPQRSLNIAPCRKYPQSKN